MRRSIKDLYKTLYRNTNGSFSLEASLLFPLLFLLTLVLVFASLYFYQNTGLYYTASTLAERTAYVWDNSNKDHKSGAFEPGQYDGLYWRTAHDNVTDMFGFIKENAYETFHFPGTLSEGKEGVPKKLQAGANQIAEGASGVFSYRNLLFDRRVHVDLQRRISLPSFTHYVLSEELHASASSGVVDPIEFIRTVNLVDNYAKRLRNKGISKQTASDAMDEFLGMASPKTFAIHQEAYDYLQQLVNGRELHLDTSHGKRMIDAFDKQGISHQAFLTFNEANLRLQLAKDVELLTDGKIVKGVVWHFFRRTNQTGRVGPGDQLLRDIESKGIVVVIHD